MQVRVVVDLDDDLVEPVQDATSSRGPDVVREQLVEVEPGAERALTSAQDQHPQVGVAVHLADDLVEPVQQLDGDGVLLVRPVQPHAGDLAVLLEHDVVGDRHGRVLF